VSVAVISGEPDTREESASTDLDTLWRESRVPQTLDVLDRRLVGLDVVKDRVREIASLLIVDGLRRELELTSQRPSLHMCFTGDPGTGKTTVAMLMAKILHGLGWIERDHLLAVRRDDLVGQYVGHTAPKTADVLKRARGGVLFIDEAYYLHRPENDRDYGPEAIEVLLAAMESERERLVVVFAGYEDRMDTFFRSNPGMGSRVAHHIHFPRYTLDQLMDIARLMVGEQTYTLSGEAEAALATHLAVAMTEPEFAQARSVRNVIERARLRQATRLCAGGGRPTRTELTLLAAQDIVAATSAARPS
jgi:probable Rubsico expression protein CbbX